MSKHFNLTDFFFVFCRDNTLLVGKPWLLQQFPLLLLIFSRVTNFLCNFTDRFLLYFFFSSGSSSSVCSAAPVSPPYLRSSSSQSQSQSHSSSRQAGHSSSLSCQYSHETGTHWDVECTLSMAFSSIAIVSPMSLLTMVRSKKWPYACRSMSDSFARRSRLPS